MMISMKKGTPSSNLRFSNVVKGSSSPTIKPMEAQQSCAKLQWMKRWVRVLSSEWQQQTQEYDGRAIFFLLNNSLVDYRSFSSNQKNTLCLFWQADVGTPSHTQHPLACRWKKKMRGRRRTQEEHTKWSCLICELQLLSHFIDTSSQGEHLQGKTL